MVGVILDTLKQIESYLLMRHYDGLIKTKDITFESKEEVKWTLDGEFGGIHNNVNLKVCQKAVDFIVKKRRKKEEKDLLN